MRLAYGYAHTFRTDGNSSTRCQQTISQPQFDCIPAHLHRIFPADPRPRGLRCPRRQSKISVEIDFSDNHMAYYATLPRHHESVRYHICKSRISAYCVIKLQDMQSTGILRGRLSCLRERIFCAILGRQTSASRIVGAPKTLLQ